MDYITINTFIYYTATRLTVTDI